MKTFFGSGAASVLSGCLMAVSLYSCKSTDISTRYTSNYIHNTDNKVINQVPETYELGYIVLSLTDFAQKDSNLINKNTPYYREVADYFGKYKNDNAVKALNQDLKKDFNRFARFRNGLYAFKLNHNRFVLKNDYRVDMNKVDFKRYAPLLQQFANKTNFQDFYKNHQSFYNTLINDKAQQLTKESAQNLVKSQYATPFHSYQIIMSPLMKGYASNYAIGGSKFNECLIFTQPGSAILYNSQVIGANTKAVVE